MTDIQEIRCPIAGVTGPGVTTFYADDAASMVPLIQAGFATMQGRLPSPVTWQFPDSGNILDDTDGAIAGAWGPIGAVSNIGGVDSSAYTDVAGACIRWHTNGLVRRHRVVGRTFIVPLGGTCWSTGGDINSSALATLRAAASAMITTGGHSLLVWSRPVYTGTGPTRVLLHPGQSFPVITATISDVPAILRSRRD